MTNPIEAAVAPLKEEAVTRAEQDARALVQRRIELLEEAGWNLDKVAPYPKSLYSRSDYVSAKRYRAAFEAITRSADTCGYRRLSDPYIVVVDREGVDLFVENCIKAAAAAYDAFVIKLIGKIGACDSAELEGSHVWGHSILTVCKGESVERWKTQQIVNQSVHGLLFNQWPSRKVK